jgi:abhydrolase domain-containing protein 6
MDAIMPLFAYQLWLITIRWFILKEPMISIALSILAVFIALLVAAYFCHPNAAAVQLIALNRMLAKLTLKTVSIPAHTVHYLEGGQGAPVLLLHGIFAEKDHWTDFARYLTKHYRVFAPDLPGFGSSGRLPDQSYGYAAQVERLKEWMDALHIAQAHIAGSSMGGTIAALFASRYPQRVLSVACIGAPHGIQTPLPSDMDASIVQGTCPLIVHSAQEFELMLDFLFKRRPFLPYPIAQKAMREAIGSAASNLRIWNEQLKDRYLLNTSIATVVSPMLVLWGAHDRLFDVSGIEVVRAKVPGAGIHVLKGIGHLPMMEAPKASAQAYARFLGSL